MTHTTITMRSSKTETARQMTKMRTGNGSSVVVLAPPDVGTILLGKTSASAKGKTMS